jgi:hypothetical protein
MRAVGSLAVGLVALAVGLGKLDLKVTLCVPNASDAKQLPLRDLAALHP